MNVPKQLHTRDQTCIKYCIKSCINNTSHQAKQPFIHSYKHLNWFFKNQSHLKFCLYTEARIYNLKIEKHTFLLLIDYDDFIIIYTSIQSITMVLIHICN